MDLRPEQYVEICSIFTEVMSGHPMATHAKQQLLAAITESRPEQIASRIAKLKIGFAQMQWLPPQQVEKLEALLVARGLPNLESLVQAARSYPEANIPPWVGPPD
jgi:hypothetical protein